MKRDLKPIIRDLSKFLGRHLTELSVLRLDDHLYIDNFRRNPAVNMEAMAKTMEGGKARGEFIRKGKVGDWKNYFTPEIAREWGRWAEVKKFQHGVDKDFSE